MSCETQSRISVNAAATQYGLDRRTVTGLVAGLKSRPGAHRARLYDAADVARVVGEYQQSRRGRGTDRDRYEKARADRVELEVAKLRGDMLSRQELADRVKALGSEINATLMKALVTEWPGQAAGLGSAELRELGEQTHRAIVRRFRQWAEAEW